jgi:hypothetical protein
MQLMPQQVLLLHALPPGVVAPNHQHHQQQQQRRWVQPSSRQAAGPAFTQVGAEAALRQASGMQPSQWPDHHPEQQQRQQQQQRGELPQSGRPAGAKQSVLWRGMSAGLLQLGMQAAGDEQQQQPRHQQRLEQPPSNSAVEQEEVPAVTSPGGIELQQSAVAEGLGLSPGRLVSSNDAAPAAAAAPPAPGAAGLASTVGDGIVGAADVQQDGMMDTTELDPAAAAAAAAAPPDPPAAVPVPPGPGQALEGAFRAARRSIMRLLGHLEVGSCIADSAAPHCEYAAFHNCQLPACGLVSAVMVC